MSRADLGQLPSQLDRQRARSAARGARRMELGARAAASTRRRRARSALAVTESAHEHPQARRRRAASLVRARASGDSAAASRSSRSTRARASPTSRRSLRDGHSTAGTPGTGLGALSAAGRRVRHLLAARARHGAARWSSGRRPDRARQRRSSSARVCVPMPGETVCGDGWAIDAGATGADRAGGRRAGPRARCAPRPRARRRECSRAPADDAPDAIIERVSRRAAPARAAPRWRWPGSIAGASTVRFAGVGNIAGRVDGGVGQRATWCRTTAPSGTRCASVQEFALPWPAGRAAGHALRRARHALGSGCVSRACATRHPALDRRRAVPRP